MNIVCPSLLRIAYCLLRLRTLARYDSSRFLGALVILLVLIHKLGCDNQPLRRWANVIGRITGNQSEA